MKFANLGKNIAIITKFNSTLSVEWPKNRNILKNEIKYKWKILLVSKLWKSERLAFLKFFHAFLEFDLPKACFLNFPQNSTLSLIGPFLIIGDCVYAHHITTGTPNFFTLRHPWILIDNYVTSLEYIVFLLHNQANRLTFNW